MDAYRELFERSADAILIIEGETFIDCNDATVQMLRYRDKKQVLQTHPSELSPPTQPDGRDSRDKASEMIAVAFERGSHRFEWEHVRADGEVFPVEVLLTSVQEPGRRVLHVVWRDITERKRLEAELRQAQRTEAIGRLAGGIAHDFNNLLVVLVGNTDLLRMEVEDDPAAREFVEEIQQACNRASRLVGQLLAFSRRQEIVERVIDVNALIEKLRGLLERLIGEDIELTCNLGGGSLRVLGDSGQLEQVILNLVTNARDAMTEGGTLTIATRLVDRDHPLIGGTESPPAEPAVCITVSDTGVGMSARAREHAFDPFFTTKETARGTGLGLSTVHGIVQQARGRIAIRSTPGAGTEVCVSLPLATGDPDEPEAEWTRPEIERGTETLLLVEDEQAVASMLIKVLTRAGYTVLTAGNGREALDLYLDRAAEIELIVTDVIMPELGGVELVNRLCEAGHEPRVLFTSGYTDQELSRMKGLDRLDVDLLRKPFHAQDLAHRVRRALDGG